MRKILLCSNQFVINLIVKMTGSFYLTTPNNPQKDYTCPAIWLLDLRLSPNFRWEWRVKHSSSIVRSLDIGACVKLPRQSHTADIRSVFRSSLSVEQQIITQVPHWALTHNNLLWSSEPKYYQMCFSTHNLILFCWEFIEPLLFFWFREILLTADYIYDTYSASL